MPKYALLKSRAVMELLSPAPSSQGPELHRLMVAAMTFTSLTSSCLFVSRGPAECLYLLAPWSICVRKMSLLPVHSRILSDYFCHAVLSLQQLSKVAFLKFSWTCKNVCELPGWQSLPSRNSMSSGKSQEYVRNFLLLDGCNIFLGSFNLALVSESTLCMWL